MCQPTDSENNDAEDPIDALMMRCYYLKQLRQLEQQDEAERAKSNLSKFEQQDHADFIHLAPGVTLLHYESFLRHQDYYDDLKHIDHAMINYGNFGTDTPLLIEQDKRLGKGGLCWDAAFILGEYLIEILEQTVSPISIIELGCGTGICGLMVAKAAPVKITMTDLPELMPLLQRNLGRNFN